jgi:predicted metal-dependent hydrolase
MKKNNKSIVTTKEIFQHGNNNILYNLVRSKRQKTSELIIENENEITLRVPFDKPLEEIKEIIQKKIHRILKKQDEYRKTTPEIEELSYLPSSTLPYLGNNYTIEFRNIHTGTDSNTTSLNDNEKAELNDNNLLFYLKDVENYQDTNDEYIKNKIKELYENWLYEQAQIIFKEKINKFSKMMEVDPKDWQIKKLKNRWGSVTKNKKIVLNMNLIKTSENIIDYIIIHELCHLKIEGHSHNFWNLLHKFVPDYNERIKWLELNSKNILKS